MFDQIYLCGFLEVYKYVKLGIIYVNMEHGQYMESYDLYMKFGAFKIN
jgi:hypothetical protein